MRLQPTPPHVGTRLSMGCLMLCAKDYRNGTLLKRPFYNVNYRGR
jgi:hypothetical protein